MLKKEKIKNPCQRAWGKERKKKERNKDSPYFQIKGIHQKEGESWSKEYKNILELGRL